MIYKLSIKMLHHKILLPQHLPKKYSGDLSCEIGLNLLQTLTWGQHLDDEVVYSNLDYVQTFCEVTRLCQQFVHNTCHKWQANSNLEPFHACKFGTRNLFGIPYNREKSGNLGQIKVELREHKEVISPSDLWDQCYFNVSF